ncbi:MAG: multidrug efflux RND transporter permease subunit [Planctomycetes bacterium]|nr:multidrug efflux RND transporter permease subunit [Planctomycetota bacterium]
MFSRFFINRPVFASVISILIVLAGGASIVSLPIAQYPEICPPVVQVSANYPGANPQNVADSVAAPIEQQVNGVDNMLYMISNSCSDGSYILNVTFKLGTNPDMANVLVQNRVSWAMAQLPPAVQQQGVITKKASTTMVSVICMKSAAQSPDRKNTFDDLYITNYATIRIIDELNRIPGVGNVVVYPNKNYSMRVWLDPQRMQARGLTTADVVNALSQQNVQVSAGQLGQQPAQGTNYQLTINTTGRLGDPKEFEDVIIKTGSNSELASVVRVRDIADVKMGGQVYDTFSIFNGSPGATIIVYQSPGSNLVQVSDSVQKTMARLGADFPPGLEYKIIYQISDFVRASIKEVVKTLIEAFILVFIVVFIFLQNWRATIIPAVTIPVSLIGTFFVMSLMGFSINLLTLFGMVLAIGIVVDDAIVVVENVERNMTQFGLSGKEAAIKAMQEISGAIIGITLVLMSVFVPAAFVPGITGQFYRQFSLTIAVTTLFSAINALTLSPALCALLLKPAHDRKKNFFFRGFNTALGKLTGGYVRTVGLGARRIVFTLLIFAAMIGLTGLGLKAVPTGFIPLEDDGLILVSVQLPDSASLERTRATVENVAEILRKTDGVANVGAQGGVSVVESVPMVSPFAAIVFAPLKPWDQRSRNKTEIMGELSQKLSRIQEAVVFPFSLPPVTGLGKGGGFELYAQDKADAGLVELQHSVEELAFKANSDPILRNCFTTYRATVPSLFVDIDRTKVFNLDIPLQNVFDTMQAFLGSKYVNDFNKFSRTWQVRVQAESEFRTKVDDITGLQVRNSKGKMVPLGSVASVNETVGPQVIIRYNMYPSARVAGSAAPGVGSGQALEQMEKIAKQDLPAGMEYAWTGMAYQEKDAGSPAAIFIMAIIVVVLVLAAQYESWIDSFSVVLVVPLAVLGAMAGLLIRGLDNNIYTQVGLTLLVGLAAKNAILIVEFAREGRARGLSPIDAAIEAGRLRLRPILMTSFAFILGVVPLVIAEGAGAVSRRALGTAVFSGMLGVTILGVVFTPVMYVAMQILGEKIKRLAGSTAPAAPATDRSACNELHALRTELPVPPLPHGPELTQSEKPPEPPKA